MIDSAVAQKMVDDTSFRKLGSQEERKNEATTAETLNKQDSSEHNTNTKRNNTHVFA